MTSEMDYIKEASKEAARLVADATDIAFQIRFHINGAKDISYHLVLNLLNDTLITVAKVEKAISNAQDVSWMEEQEQMREQEG